jgi:citrate lyase beta subunit
MVKGVNKRQPIVGRQNERVKKVKESILQHRSFGHFVGWSAYGVTTEAEDAANARLIAAAPELLEALKLIVDDYATTPGAERTRFHYRVNMRACAAIAKAEGESVIRRPGVRT